MHLLAFLNKCGLNGIAPLLDAGETLEATLRMLTGDNHGRATQRQIAIAQVLLEAITHEAIKCAETSLLTKATAPLGRQEAQDLGHDVTLTGPSVVGDNVDGGKDEEAYHLYNMLLIQSRLYYGHLSQEVPGIESLEPADLKLTRGDWCFRFYNEQAQIVRLLVKYVPAYRCYHKFFPDLDTHRLSHALGKSIRLGAELLPFNQSDNADVHHIMAHINGLFPHADLGLPGAPAIVRLGERGVNGGDQVILN
jgi:hypothetical protein